MIIVTKLPLDKYIVVVKSCGRHAQFCETDGDRQGLLFYSPDKEVSLVIEPIITSDNDSATLLKELLACLNLGDN